MSEYERELLLLMAKMLGNEPVGPSSYSDQVRLDELVSLITEPHACEFCGHKGQKR